MGEFKVGRELSYPGQEKKPALGRDTTLVTRDFILQCKLEGRVFFAQQGNAGTKLDFAETTYDEDQPQFALIVPSGTLCIPLSLSVTNEDPDGTEQHVIWSKCSVDIGNGTSTALAPVNYRRDALNTPACRANSLYTGNGTMTGLIEIRRWFHEYASAAVTDMELYQHRWTINDPDMPILVGPETLLLHSYATGTAPQGYGEYTWIELLASEFGL